MHPPDAPRHASPSGRPDIPLMQAITLPRYGSTDALRLKQVPVPLPGDTEVLIRVQSAGLCKGDVHLMTGRPTLLRLAGYGLLRPARQIPGQNIAGVICAVGKKVTTLRVGQPVFGITPGGAFAEYALAPADQLVTRSTHLSADAAAASPVSGLTALQALRDIGDLKAGQQVLINGAAGGVGTFAVQIARTLGAEITAVCSGGKVAAVRSLGADRVIDYRRDDPAACGIRHDVVLDLVGNRPARHWLPILTPGGTYISCAGGAGGDWLGPLLWILQVVATGKIHKRRMLPFLMRPNAMDLLILKALLERRQIVPLIDRRLPLNRTPEGLHHVMTGQALGCSVIQISAPAAEPLTPDR